LPPACCHALAAIIDDRKIASLYRTLLRAGFSSDTIRRELKRATAEDLPEIDPPDETRRGTIYRAPASPREAAHPVGAQHCCAPSRQDLATEAVFSYYPTATRAQPS
jgi:hypothetical protein